MPIIVNEDFSIYIQLAEDYLRELVSECMEIKYPNKKYKIELKTNLKVIQKI